ncbi:hypothetical protein, partial [Pseudoruegeria sp. SK021]|uniref:hypothetical protein n=1 Tax=Pseudoruegeria sp. SK021 TaxID=1933035 RepID=UPI00197FBAD6
MIAFPAGVKVWIAGGVTDMRRRQRFLEPCMDGTRGARADRSSLAFGQLRPCIRRLNCSSLTARPDEF